MTTETTLHKVFLAGVAFDCPEQDLLDFFQRRYKSVKKIDLIKQRKNKQLNKGCGFMELEDPEEVADLLGKARFRLRGREFQVKKYKKGEELKKFKKDLNRRRLFIQNVDKGVDNGTLRGFFESFVDLEDAYLVKTEKFDRVRKKKEKRVAGEQGGVGEGFGGSKGVGCGPSEGINYEEKLQYGYLILKRAEDSDTVLCQGTFWIGGALAVVEKFDPGKHNKFRKQPSAEEDGQKDQKLVDGGLEVRGRNEGVWEVSGGVDGGVEIFEQGSGRNKEFYGNRRSTDLFGDLGDFGGERPAGQRFQQGNGQNQLQRSSARKKHNRKNGARFGVGEANSGQKSGHPGRRRSTKCPEPSRITEEGSGSKAPIYQQNRNTQPPNHPRDAVITRQRSRNTQNYPKSAQNGFLGRHDPNPHHGYPEAEEGLDFAQGHPNINLNTLGPSHAAQNRSLADQRRFLRNWAESPELDFQGHEEDQRAHLHGSHNHQQHIEEPEWVWSPQKAAEYPKNHYHCYGENSDSLPQIRWNHMLRGSLESPRHTELASDLNNRQIVKKRLFPGKRAFNQRDGSYYTYNAQSYHYWNEDHQLNPFEPPKRQFYTQKVDFGLNHQNSQFDQNWGIREPESAPDYQDPAFYRRRLPTTDFAESFQQDMSEKDCSQKIAYNHHRTNLCLNMRLNHPEDAKKHPKPASKAIVKPSGGCPHQPKRRHF